MTKKTKYQKISKIIVVDAFREEHVFRGNNLGFWHQGSVCRVWDRNTDETLASFTNPASITTERV